MPNELNKPISGTVDQILQHCHNSNFDISDEEYRQREYEKSIEFLMNEEKISREDAIALYNMIVADEVRTIVDDLVEKGLVEIEGYNEDGEPKFQLTELGKKCAEELNND